MSRYKSRAKRLDEWRSEQQIKLDQLRGSIENEALEDDAKLTDGEVDLASVFDLGEIESLKEEIEEWRDNMEGAGTNLETTEKFTTVSECADALDGIYNDLESALQSVDTVGDLSTALDEIETAFDECDNVEFPGMYG